MFHCQRLQKIVYRCHAPVHEMGNQTLSNRFSTFFLGSGAYERREECFLDSTETVGEPPQTETEVNNLDKSKRRSLRSALRVDVIGRPGPGEGGPWCVCAPYVCICVGMCVCVCL